MRHSLRMVAVPCGRTEGKPRPLSEAGRRSASEQKDEPRFLWQPEKCAASVVGCGGGKPHMNVRPLSLAALELSPVQFRRVYAIYGNAVHEEN